MEEIMQTIWSYALPIGGGLTVGAIITAIAGIVIKAIIDKTFKKINIQDIEDKAVAKGVEKVKTYTFKHNIQPVVNSELEKIVEKVDARVDNKLDQVNAKYDNLITCFEKFTAYFDNSIGVPDVKKQELKEAIEKAKTADMSLVNTCVEEEVKEIEKPAQKGNNDFTVVR